jgi:hypothetical protein
MPVKKNCKYNILSLSPKNYNMKNAVLPTNTNCVMTIFLWTVYSMPHKWPWHHHNLLGKEPFDVTFKVHEKWVTLSVYCKTNLHAYPWHCWVKGDITEMWVGTFGVVSHQYHYFGCMCGMCNHLVNATNIKNSFWLRSRPG